MESILDSIKKMLGITKEYKQFDAEIVMNINSVFSILHQLGVGPKECYMIEDSAQTWDEFMEGRANIELVKSYIFLKVKLIFDPSLTASVTDSYKEQIKEFEWRLNVIAEAEHARNEEIERITVSSEQVPYGTPVDVEKTVVGDTVNLHFKLPAGMKGDTGTGIAHIKLVSGEEDD